MKTIIDYLNDLVNIFGTDYKVAKALKTSQSNICSIRKRGQCGNTMARKIAIALNINEDEVLFAAAMARAKITKEALERFSKNAVLTMNSFTVIGVTRLGINHAATSIFDGLNCILCKITKHKSFAKFVTSTNLIRLCNDKFSHT